jgi:hydroxyethylthiazole kinase-like uncharacterized protein yjeF
MKLVRVKTMQELDRRTMALGTPGEVLMERAGIGAAREILDAVENRWGDHHVRRFAVIAGHGNNGGDGYVVARYLHEHTDRAVTVYATCEIEELKGDALTHARALPSGVERVVCGDSIPAAAFQARTLVVDALLGTGITGPLRPPYDKFIQQINDSGLPVAALDIPSGLNGDNGEIAGAAAMADLTLTMGLPKLGLLTGGGPEYCGQLRIIDLGMPPELISEASGCGEAITANDVRPLLARRPPGGHKGTFGHVLTVGGSLQYTGAPVLCAAAALRSGCGLSTLLVPTPVRRLIGNPPFALIMRTAGREERGFFSADCGDAVTAAAESADAVALGPGIGRQQEVRAMVQHCLQLARPLVIDADGLRHLASLQELCARSAPTVLTPHPGELRALSQALGLGPVENENDRIECASRLARTTGAFTVLKGLATVCAAPDGRTAINASGSNALATGGTGDVLTGMIASLLAQGMAPWDACCAGVFIHGLAADLGACGRRSLIADDVLHLIGAAFKTLSPFN